MPPGLRKLLWASCTVSILAVLLLVACVVLYGQIPANWSPRPPIVLANNQPFVDSQGKLVYLTQHLLIEPVGTRIETGLRVTVRRAERTMSATPGEGQQTRDEAEAAILEQFNSQCLACGLPDGAALVESAARSPGGTLTIPHGSRRLAAAFLATEPYVSSIAELALGAAVPLLLYTLYRVHVLRRRVAANQCPRCGYALTGLREGASCPECNLDAAAHRVKIARRVGLLRIVAGWVTIGVAAAAGGACAYTFPSQDWALPVFSSASTSSEPWRFGLLMGGVYAGKDRASLRSAFPVARASPPWVPDAVSTRRWSATWYTLGPIQTCYWFALWPLVPVLASAGLWIRWCGVNAHGHARAAADPAAPSPMPSLTVRRFLLRWGMLSAGFVLLLAMPLLAPQGELHIRDFARDNRGMLFPAYDYANGGAEAKLQRTIRNSPLILLTRDALTWFPQPPRPDELAAAISQDPSMMSQDVLTANDLARPSGTRWSFQVQAGALVAPICAIFLVHPLSAAFHIFPKRRKGEPQPAAGTGTP